MQKFYLHDATTTVTGTLPGASTLSATTPSVTATGASTNRSLGGSIGTAQASSAVTTLAQTTVQSDWFRRFISPALAAQTVTAAVATWSFHIAGSQSNTNAVFGIACAAFIWRPGTGAKVGNLWDIGISNRVFPAGTVEAAGNGGQPGSAGTSVTAIDGDVLVLEVWSQSTQTMATAYTDTVFYDGTTEDSATSNAAYILAPADLPLFTAPPVNINMAPYVPY